MENTKKKDELPMDSKMVLRLMTELYEHWNCQVLIITDPDKQHTQVDLGFRKRMNMPYDIELHTELMLSRIQKNMLYLYTDKFLISYALFRLPEALWEEIRETPAAEAEAAQISPPVLCIGPILFHTMNTVEISSVMARLKISPGHRQDMAEHYNLIPLFSSQEIFIHTLQFFLKRLTQEPVLFREISYGQESWGFSDPEGADYALPEQPEVAIQAIEERYEAERALMKAVGAGKTNEATLRYQRFISYRLAPRGLSALRDKKNILFVLNTLLRKAVQFGGVHPFHIDNISRSFSIQIEAGLTLEQLDQLSYRMVRKYCILVQNYARKNYSPLVQRCMNTIDFSYSAELSLSWLAAQCGVSDSYLSTSFRKETGMTVTDCINRTRIRQALILLNTSELPIGDIASRCGFPDANYFSRVFRKQQGLSPKQYRDRIRKGREE